MKTLGYYNGKFGPLEEMTVPMNDRACYFGDGVYEATLARNGKIFALKEHLDRFFNSAGLLRIEIPYTREELTAILYDMLAKMDDSDIFIYWQMTRGTGIRQHQFPEKGTKPNLWIFMKPGKPADSSKRLKLTDGMRLPPRRCCHRVRPQQCLHHQRRDLQDSPDRPLHPPGHHKNAHHPDLQRQRDPGR